MSSHRNILERASAWMGGWDTHLCEAKEESDTSKDLQGLSCMVQHHVPTGETGTRLFARLEGQRQKILGEGMRCQHLFRAQGQLKHRAFPLVTVSLSRSPTSRLMHQ